jgi:hypothetical protein
LGRPENPAAVRNASASRMLPSSMTTRVCRRSATRTEGSPQSRERHRLQSGGSGRPERND